MGDDILRFKLFSLVGLLVIAFISFGYVLRKSRDRASAIDLEDLIVEVGPDGKRRISKVAVLTFCAFFASVWALVYKTIGGDSIDTIYTAFMAVWAAPFVAVILKGRTELPQLPGVDR